MTHTRRQCVARRGKQFEEVINQTNEAYERLGRACITRKAIPGKYIAPTNIRGRGPAVPPPAASAHLKTGIAMPPTMLRQIPEREATNNLRVFVPESRAEPDYGGVIAPTGRGIFYDAKTTKRDLLDFDNLHPHQVTFLERMAACGAVAGFLVEFAAHRSVFFLPIQIVTRLRAAQRRKSVPYRFCAEQLAPAQPGRGLVIYDYLTAVERQEQLYGADYDRLSPL